MRSALLVISWHPSIPGGVTTAVLNLHDQLIQSLGWGARLLVDTSLMPASRAETVDGREVSFVGIRPPYVQGRALRSAIAFAIYFLPAAFSCRRLLRQRAIEMVNLHFPGVEALFWVLLKKCYLYKGALVLSFHGADVTRIRHERSFYERLMWRVIVANSTALTACSHQLADELKQLFPWGSAKVHVLPNGVDVSRIHAESRSSQVDVPFQAAPYLISIAGFEHKKGLDVLLTAFSRLNQRFPAIRLLLVCRQGPDMSTFCALVENLGLADKVHIEVDCPHERAMSFLARAEALVVPSRKEPFGIVVLEAAALSRPVIATECCGVLEWIDRDLVVIVPSGDANALASAMAQLLSDTRQANDQGTRLMEAVAKSFSWAHSARLLLVAAGESV
jgi:glycosyltransferase involved in cell wall biosynthesis